MLSIRHQLIFPLLFLLTLLIFLLSRNIGMFWDNVLFASKMGNHLYNTGIFNISMPDSFDPGHPPFLAFINALGWKLFGHKLWVSHLMMTPFVFGFFLQLYRFINYFYKDTILIAGAFILICADPTLASHLILVNPQIIQLFFALLAINGILENKPVHKIIGLGLLGIVTFRGMMMCAGIVLFDLVRVSWIEKKNLRSFFNFRNLFHYFLSALPALAYVIWRFSTKGWLQTHPDSPWENLWHLANIEVILRNILVLANRYLDFGRIGIFLFIFLVLIFKRSLFREKQTRTIFLLALLVDIVTVIVSLSATNTMGHRYFIASNLCFALLAFNLLIQLRPRISLYIALLLVLGTGNLWIYPEKIAQGWDSTLAHVPYFRLRTEALAYMNTHNIPVDQTASFFPNCTIVDFVDLSGDQRSFVPFNGNNRYVFYSNVFNISDEQLYILSNQYTPIVKFTKCRIHVTLYKSD